MTLNLFGPSPKQILNKISNIYFVEEVLDHDRQPHVKIVPVHQERPSQEAEFSEGVVAASDCLSAFLAVDS